MEELDLDNWFFCLPADWQEKITGIKRGDYGITDEIDGTPKCDRFYEKYDNAVSDWWYDLVCEEKQYIYDREELGL